MTAFLISLVFSAMVTSNHNYYITEATATEHTNYTTIYTDITGNMWEDNNNYNIGANVYLIMDGMNTNSIYDDCIVAIMER